MNERIVGTLLEEIDTLEKRCQSLEVENVKIKTENDEINKFCEHLFTEIDFLKSLVNEVPSRTDDSEQQPQTIFELDHLLNDYEINNNESTLIDLFDKFPDKHRNILTAIRDCLPDNIGDIAIKYKFEQDLNLLIKSNKLINDYEKNGETFEKRGPLELVDKYIHNFNSNSKTGAYRYLEQALLCYPLTYKEQFISKIQAYLFDDFDVKLTEIFNQLYNEKSVRKSRKTSVKKEVKPVVKPVVKQTQPEAKKYNLIDYTFSVANLVEITRGCTPRLYETASRVVKGMKRNKRSEADVNEYITEINKYLRKKL